MNVGVNIRTANLAVPDGHGESMRNLSRALVTTNPGHTIDFVADAPARFDLPSDRRAALRVLRPFPAGNRLLRGAFGADPWYRARVMLNRHWRRWSVYFQSAHEPTPVRTGPRHVVYVHDLAFMRTTGTTYFDAEVRAFLDLWTAENVHRADAVVAVSAWTRDQVARIYAANPDRVHVAPHGVDRSRFRPDYPAHDLRACADRYGLRDPYIAFIGTLQPRKNLGTLAEAFRLARDRGLSHDLAIVGRRGWRYEDIAAQLEGREESGICLVGAAPPRDLPLLLAGADAFVSVGIDEGFGMPVLEAMASGVPVVASDQAGLADAAGDAGLRVDPHDVEAIAAALLRIASDAELRADLRARGLARAADHTWERTARAVWTAMEQACESS